MMIYVDADACPVKDDIADLAIKHNIDVIMVCNGGIRPHPHHRSPRGGSRAGCRRIRCRRIVRDRRCSGPRPHPTPCRNGGRRRLQLGLDPFPSGVENPATGPGVSRGALTASIAIALQAVLTQAPGIRSGP